MPHEDENLTLLKYVKKLNPKILVFLLANQTHHALNFYSHGADYVIVPQILGGEKVSGLLDRVISNKNTLKDVRNKHLKTLLSLDSRYR